jgi:LysM repeat protein
MIPSTTPYKHTIQPGETLYSLALQYNISLAQLVLANPGIDTSLLSIGTELVIPRADDAEDGIPTPTPYPISTGDPVCYPTEDKGFWCYTLVENDHNIALENITMAFNIFIDDQQQSESVIAISPLNLLFPGQSSPVGVLIEDLPVESIRVTASLLTAFPTDLEESIVEISDFSIHYSQENRIAEISGTFEITEPDLSGQSVWIAGTALNDGAPVGVRKWISREELQGGTPYPFSFQIYSLGPRIDQVQLLAEAH